MRVLWITNIILPPLCGHLGVAAPVVGGWMYSSAKALLAGSDDIELAVATVYDGDKLQEHDIDGIKYFLLPMCGRSRTKYLRHMEPLWKKISAGYRPHLVHLHGTEFPFGLALLKADPELRTVASLQGIVSAYGRYYTANIPFSDIFASVTLRDVVRMDTIWHGQREFNRRGGMERDILGSVDHIIGRTSWDKAHAWAINPQAQYHFCNETLRDEFYKYTWSYEKCEPHTIFLSQAGYPIKGLHQVLKAMPLVLKSYPDARLVVAGQDITGGKSLLSRLKRTGYGSYISRLIRRYGLEEKVTFTGFLDERQICEQYLKANIFVCPSSIENSPNSLGEAQLLGVPCLASYVGGVPDMMRGDESHMYRFEEVEMLARKICELFESHDDELLAKMRERALQRHDKMTNAVRLAEIYRKICNI